MSFRELAKTSGKKEPEVKAVLMQRGLVRKIEEPGVNIWRWRYRLTDKGWQYRRYLPIRHPLESTEKHMGDAQRR